MQQELTVIPIDQLRTMIAEIIDDRIKPSREILTLSQLAAEWQVSKQAIINWTRRESFNLPVHYLGSEPRFHRSEIDEWSREEARRKLANAA
jgi:predicted DNA-binding transcriptional regulator AlpA